MSGWQNENENEEEENIIDIGNGDIDKIAPFCSVYSTPPEKVKCSDPELGIGTFYEIDKSSGHYVYQFQNGRLFEIWWLFLSTIHGPIVIVTYCVCHSKQYIYGNYQNFYVSCAKFQKKILEKYDF